MPDGGTETKSLHERTLVGVDEVIGRALNYVEGLEKVVVSRAVQVLQPRVEKRIQQAPEDDLRRELKYLHDLLGDILHEPAQKKRGKSKAKRKKSKDAKLRVKR